LKKKRTKPTSLSQSTVNQPSGKEIDDVATFYIIVFGILDEARP